DWSVMAQDTYHFQGDNVANFQDSQFHGGKLSSWATVNLTNCLLERMSVDIEPFDSNPMTIRNNLFFGGTFILYPTITNALVRDNLFDRTAIPYDLNDMGYNGGYNAFVTNYNRLVPTNSTDIILSNAPVYCVGPQGDYYYPTND